MFYSDLKPLFQQRVIRKESLHHFKEGKTRYPIKCPAEGKRITTDFYKLHGQYGDKRLLQCPCQSRWASNVIRDCLSFYLLPSVIGPEKLASLFQPIRCKTKTNHDLVCRVFPGFGHIGRFHFEFSLALQGIFLSSDWPL